YNQVVYAVKYGSIPFVSYNSKARVSAARIHDIHHVLTGYGTPLKGETEIGAWGISSGCGKYWAAWLLNLVSFSIGIVFWSRAVWMAFVRGRHSRSLYTAGADEKLLNANLSQLRDTLGLATTKAATQSDQVAFVAWGAGSYLIFVK